MEKQILYSMNPVEMQSMIIDAVNAAFSTQSPNSNPKKQAEELADQQDPYISAKEAADYLGISPGTLHLWKSKGIVPSHRINTRIRYKISELDAAMKSRKS